MDLIQWDACYFDGDNGEIIRREPIPQDLLDLCIEKRLELIGSLSEHDDRLEEFYLEEDWEGVPTDLLKTVIREHTINNNFCPVYMGSAFKNKGVQLLLDGVNDFLPNPTDVENEALD